MMKTVRTLGAAVVAFAAPVLLAAPAAADARAGWVNLDSRLGNAAPLTLAHGPYVHDASYRPRGPDYRHGVNRFGQTDREVRELARDAVQACRQAVRYEARQLGYRRVDIYDDPRVRQYGPRGFFVTFHEVEFESRRRDIETRVSCDVRQGRVTSVEGIPRPHKGKGPPPRRW